MRKVSLVFARPMLFVTLSIFVGLLLIAEANAKQREKADSSQKTAKGKKAAKANATFELVERGKASQPARSQVTKKGKKRAERRTLNAKRGRNPRSQSAQVDNETRSLLRKRGKLTRAERNKLAAYRSSRRRRARATCSLWTRARDALWDTIFPGQPPERPPR